MKEALVIPPLHFDVVGDYNTRMRPDHPHGKPDKKRTFLQWSRMVNHLWHDLGVRPIFVNPQPGLADQAFACDPGLWVDDIYVSGNFQVEPRRPEKAALEHWFRQHHCTILNMPENTYFGMLERAYFEGGDCVVVGKTLLIGYGKNRTNEAGVARIKDILEPRGVKVVPIRRVTEEFYHLNSVLTVYPSAKLICYYPEAFEAAAYSLLRDALPGYQTIPLPDQVVMREHPDFGGERLYSYCLNSIENNSKVLMPYCHYDHREILESRGLQVIVPEDGSSEFERSGGSYRCLTMIHNETS